MPTRKEIAFHLSLFFKEQEGSQKTGIVNSSNLENVVQHLGTDFGTSRRAIDYTPHQTRIILERLVGKIKSKANDSNFKLRGFKFESDDIPKLLKEMGIEENTQNPTILAFESHQELIKSIVRWINKEYKPNKHLLQDEDISPYILMILRHLSPEERNTIARKTKVPISDLVTRIYPKRDEVSRRTTRMVPFPPQN